MGFLPKFEYSYVIKSKVFQNNIKHVNMQNMGGGPEICNLPSINHSRQKYLLKKSIPPLFFPVCFSCGTNSGLYCLEGEEIKHVNLQSSQSLLFSYTEEVNDHLLFALSMCLPWFIWWEHTNPTTLHREGIWRDLWQLLFIWYQVFLLFL